MRSSITGHLFSFNNRGMRSKNPRTHNKKLYNSKMAVGARYLEGGYPVVKKLTGEEIEDYFGGDKIVCLQCGKPYKALVGHITRIHSLTADEYKEMYGLPWRKGLSCASTKELRSAIGHANMQSGINGLARMSDSERSSYRKLAHKAKHRKVTDANKQKSIKRALAINGLVSPHERKEYEAVLDAMESEDLSLAEAMRKHTHLPRRSAFDAFVRKNSDFAERYRSVLEGLSFAAKARAQMLDGKFREEVIKRRESGEKVKDIASGLGVSVQSVMNFTVGFKSPFLQKRPHCSKGHVKVNGRCQICNTERTRVRNGFLAREESLKTLINTSCDDCGCVIKVIRKYGANRRKYCASCKRIRKIASKKKYNDKRNHSAPETN